MTSNILCKKSLNSFIFLFLLCVLQIQIYAQRTTPGTAPGTPAGSTSLSDIDTINYFTGHLNVSIPITNLGGRGEAALPYSIQLEQNSWTEKYIIQEPSGNYLYYPERNESGTPAVFNNVYSGTPSMRTIQSWSGAYENCSNGEWATHTLTLLQFTAPNGTTYDLRDQNHNGRINEVGFCGTSWGNYYNRGTIFKSSDGSAATFVSDQPISDFLYPYEHNDPPPTGYLYLRNGMTYRFENGRFLWMRDRNGNVISQVTTNNNGVESIKLVDSLNREITFPVSGQPDVDTVRYQGFGGNDRNVNVHWGTLGNSLRSGQTLKTYQQLFPQMNFASDGIFNPQVISKIVLPNNLEYKLYYNSYGDIARIELPTGGAIEYEYGDGSNGGDVGRVMERRLYADGTNLSQKMVFGVATANQYDVVVTVDTYGTSLINRTKHFYSSEPLGLGYSYNMYSSWKDGKEYQTQIFAEDGTTLLRQTNQTWAQRAPVSWWTANPNFAPSNDPRVIESTTLLADSNQISKQTFTYDNFNNLTDTYDYDYGIGAPGQFLRRSHADYLVTNPVNNINYNSNGIYILGLAAQTWTSSDIAGNNKVSLTQFEYDNYATDQNHAALVARTNISGHDSNFGDVYATRGNVTQVKSFADAQNQTGGVSVYTQYDIAGNPVKTTDAKGNSITIDYSDRFGSPDAEARSNSASSQLNGQNTFAFATSATNQLGWTTYAQFDYYTGFGVDAEDINGVVNTIFYNDALDRPTQSITANNISNLRSQTTIVYDDTNRNVTATADLFSFGDGKAKVESFYDKLGRTIESRKYETGGYTAANTVYDALGRAYKATNPYRPFLNETQIWTTSEYDALGRVTKIKTPDNAEVTKSYLGSSTIVTDQAGKKRKGISDALGRMTRVIEDPDGQNLVTDYVFDTLGNLRKTTQDEQSRYFTYNSLGRLLYAKQPEQEVNAAFAATDSITGNTQWSVKYQYDNNGNITSTTDAKGVSVTGTYDNLNRLTFRDYSDSTPDVTFTYDDSTIANSKGKVTKVSSSASETKYTSFDIAGRLLTHQQITDGQAYNTAYSYNLAGALIEETYPSGRVVRNTFDQDGDLSQVQSRRASTGFHTYAGSFTYNSAGAVEKMQLGNGRWETTAYNNRLQVTQMGLGVTNADQNLLKLEYNYGAAAQNNGSLKEQKITVPTVGANQGFTATQTYAYDNLNRIQSATENVSSQQTWKQTFQYDRYGNKSFDAANTTTLGSCPQTVCNPTISTGNNRFSTGQGYSYDSAGNVTQDAEARQFLYDAENHQKEVKDAGNNSIGQYFYDGEGKRVKKISNAETVIFVYDGGGQLVAEYSTALSQVPQVSYLTADVIGSPRIITDQNGNVTSRKDYTAFGEETFTANRTQGLGYQPDNLRQDYTGYQKDDESGLDFAQARYYNSSHGRFTSVDPLTASASIKNPQTFNRYSYGLNSPYKFTDSLGLKSECPGVGNGIVTLGDCGGDINGDITGGETQRALGEYNQRLQNTLDSNAANRAIANGDQATAEAICASNSNVTCNRSDSSVTVEATVNLPDGNDHDSATEVIIWEGLGVTELNGDNWRSAAGHVSYVINGESFSWEGETTPDGKQGRYTTGDPQKYIDERRRTSAGTGYVLDFGSSKLNNKFKNELLKAYQGTGIYALTTNNCGHAFQRAINAMAGDLNISTNWRQAPAQHDAYINSVLKKYIVNKNLYPKTK